MQTLNLGILAHVDAGKTSLTERLLFAAGVIDELGSVDGGSTQTDSLALERQRGITIKSAVVSFAVADVTVNLIDTPGHPDFIAEVERVLDVLDGAVLVISAVEGVQAQTRVLMRTLRRLRIPTLIFVNKTDRPGARDDGLLYDLARKLTPAILPMGSVVALGTRVSDFRPADGGDAAFTAGLADLLGDGDDELLAAYVDDEASVSYEQLRGRLARQTRRGLVHPVYFGSAATGAGVESLTSAITELLPAAECEADGPVAGTVFKIDRGPAGEKIAYVRMMTGTLWPRDRVRYGAGSGSHSGKVTALQVFGHGLTVPADRAAVPAARLVAGQIGKLWGLAGVRIGDTLGQPLAAARSRHFAPPTLETVVVPCRAADRGALRAALDQLAEQDPLIHARQDDVRQEITVSLYGEVQKEVIQATLANDFGVAVRFRESTVVCVERVTGTGAAVERIGEAGNPFLATIGLRVDPGATGSGVAFRLEIELGALPPAFGKAIESSARDTLRQGLRGWQVSDCAVTLTHSGYWARQSHAHGTFDRSMSSTAADFRDLTPLVLMTALQQAGTQVCEPVQHFRLEVPAETVGAVLPALTRLRAVPLAQVVQGLSCSIEGDIPAARVHALEQALPALTRGEGMLDCAFDRYEPVRGTIPARPRSDRNPLSRPDYLLRVRR